MKNQETNQKPDTIEDSQRESDSVQRFVSPEVIPFHKAEDWLMDTTKPHKGEICKLEGGRSVGVSSNDEGHCYVEIDRTDDEGRIVRLSFGLSKEAAAALAVLISKRIF